MAAATAQMAECAQLQVRLAAADSRRQLAEERAEELGRKLQQVKADLAGSTERREAAERQLKQVSAKADKARQKLQDKSQEASNLQQQVQELQGHLRAAQVELHLALQQHGQSVEVDASMHGREAGTHASEQQQHQWALQQQKLQEVRTACSQLQQRLQEKTQQLSHQQQANSTLQQQLLEAQQQLVQAQQQLLQAPRLQAQGDAAPQQQQLQQQQGASAAAAADQMQSAVHRSLHGLQELLHAQSQLQLAQLQAAHGELHRLPRPSTLHFHIVCARREPLQRASLSQSTLCHLLSISVMFVLPASVCLYTCSQAAGAGPAVRAQAAAEKAGGMQAAAHRAKGSA